jgi:hypothetical protein
MDHFNTNLQEPLFTWSMNVNHNLLVLDLKLLERNLLLQSRITGLDERLTWTLWLQLQPVNTIDEKKCLINDCLKRVASLQRRCKEVGNIPWLV